MLCRLDLQAYGEGAEIGLCFEKQAEGTSQVWGTPQVTSSQGGKGQTDLSPLLSSISPLQFLIGPTGTFSILSSRVQIPFDSSALLAGMRRQKERRNRKRKRSQCSVPLSGLISCQAASEGLGGDSSSPGQPQHPGWPHLLATANLPWLQKQSSHKVKRVTNQL